MSTMRVKNKDGTWDKVPVLGSYQAVLAANEAATNAQNAANAAEAVAPEYAKTKEVLDNIVSYTNTATEQANVATAKADAANISATNAAQSYSNADAIAAQLTEYLATKENLTAPAVDKTLLIEGAAADSKVVGELKSDLSNLQNKLSRDGDVITLPHVGECNAKVKSIDGTIYSGTYNVAELFNLTSGSFTDSGVTFTISENHITANGTATDNVYFCLNDGLFGWQNLTRDGGYILPSLANMYLKMLIVSSTETGSVSSVSLHSKTSGNVCSVTRNSLEAQFVPSDDCGILYMHVPKNTTLSYDFYLGLFTEYGGSLARVQTESNVEVITNEGMYSFGEYTWTTSDTYEIVEYFDALEDINSEIEKVSARLSIPKTVWFGDSISQLQLLPHRVSDILNAEIDDCSFAGSPMVAGVPDTYGALSFVKSSESAISGIWTEQETAIRSIGGSTMDDKLANLERLKNTDWDTIKSVIVMYGTNDLNNDYVPSIDEFKNGMRTAITNFLSHYPQIQFHFISPIYRDDVQTYKHFTITELVEAEKEVCAEFNIPFFDLYHNCEINQYTVGLYLLSDKLHQNTVGDEMLSKKIAKWLMSH